MSEVVTKKLALGCQSLALFGLAVFSAHVRAALSERFEFKPSEIMVMDGSQGKLAEWQAILSRDYFFLAIATDEAATLNQDDIEQLVTKRCTAICNGYGYKECAGYYGQNLDVDLVESLGNEPAQSQIVEQDASGVFQKSSVIFDDKTGQSKPGKSVFYKLQCSK